MHVAILCPGPSLLKINRSDLNDYDYLIGVNNAVKRISSDAWVFGDDVTFRSITLRNEPEIWTSAETAKRLRRLNPPNPISEWDQLWSFLPPEAQTPIYSSVGALLFVEFICGESVDIYGCDMAGEFDFEGNAGNRTPDRWRKERKCFDAAKAWLLNRGVGVNQI